MRLVRPVAFVLACQLGSSLLGAQAYSPSEDVNLLLGPDYSHWLVGPIGRIVDKKERAAYLEVATDSEAAAFIEEFWQKRDPDPSRSGNPFRELFERRREEADRRFGEAGYPGWRSDRGTIFIVYGEPEETDYEISRTEGGPPIELWKYPKKGEKGLDGERPDREYRFVRIDDHTVFYRRGMESRSPQRELERRRDLGRPY